MDMKSKLFLLLAVFTVAVGTGFGQTPSIEYFTADWGRTNDRNQAVFYREITYGANGVPVGITKDFYADGALQWQGFIAGFNKDGAEIFNGWCSWYFPNGQRERLSHFDKSGLLDSTTFYWRENGVLRLAEEYKNGLLNGITTAFYPDGTPQLSYICTDGMIDSKLEETKYYAYDGTGKYFITNEDDFNDNKNKWTLGKTDEYSLTIAQGKMTFEMEALPGVSSFTQVYATATSDFVIETAVRFEQGDSRSGRGMIWGFNDWNNYNYFIISANGYFQAGSVIEGVETTIFDWTSSAALKLGNEVNIIGIKKLGDTIVFMANTQTLGQSASNDMTPGPYVGLFCTDGKNTTSFDRFLFMYDDEEEDLLFPFFFF